MTWLTHASDNGWILRGICDVAVSAALLNWCTVPISHATYTEITRDGRQRCSWHSENEVPSTVIFHFIHCQSTGLIYFTSEEHLISFDTYNSYSWNSTVQYLVTFSSSKRWPGIFYHRYERCPNSHWPDGALLKSRHSEYTSRNSVLTASWSKGQEELRNAAYSAHWANKNVICHMYRWNVVWFFFFMLTKFTLIVKRQKLSEQLFLQR